MEVERVGISGWSWNSTLNRIGVKLQIGDLSEMSSSTCLSSGLKWGKSRLVVPQYSSRLDVG